MADETLLLALDQGTSSSRAAVFNTRGDLIATASAPLPIHYPADGWVEQDPSAIWNSQLQLAFRVPRIVETPGGGA